MSPNAPTTNVTSPGRKRRSASSNERSDDLSDLLALERDLFGEYFDNLHGHAINNKVSNGNNITGRKPTHISAKRGRSSTSLSPRRSTNAVDVLPSPRPMILDRMNKLIKENPEPLAKIGGHCIDWFGDDHRSQLNSLVVFKDRLLDEAIRKIMLLDSSQSSVRALVRNLIHCFYDEDVIFELNPQSLLDNQEFHDTFAFAVDVENRVVDKVSRQAIADTINRYRKRVERASQLED